MPKQVKLEIGHFDRVDSTHYGIRGYVARARSAVELVRYVDGKIVARDIQRGSLATPIE
jgi:hypothetical protein